MKRASIFLIIMVGFLYSQDFTMTPLPVHGLIYSTADCGDYDNDGDLDIVMTGLLSTIKGQTLSKSFLRNDGNLNFTEIDLGNQIYSCSNGSLDWGDYDKDGDLDILLTGQVGTDVGVSVVEVNNGGTFDGSTCNMSSAYESAGQWGDYDNDGDLDALITGLGRFGAVTDLYKNDNTSFFTKITTGMQEVYECATDWGDYDNDGDLDIALCGMELPGHNYSIIYRNDSGGVFTDIGAGLDSVYSGCVKWGDYDADSDLDLLLSGSKSYSVGISKIYRNDSGIFTDIAAPLPQARNSSCDWGDYDNDGDLDVLVSGLYIPISVFRNDSGSFVNISAGLRSSSFSKVMWADLDNDGDLDIFVSDENNDGYAYIYRNNTVTANTVPDPPVNLGFNYDGTDLTLTWDKASDAETPQNGLTYNVYFSTVPGTENIAVSMSDPATGYRRIVSKGNAGVTNSFLLKNMPRRRYYWSVQSVDNCYAGSEFAEMRIMDNSFTEITDSLANVSWSSADWGDYDSDGDADILLTGSYVSDIYRNDGSGAFVNIGAGMTPVSSSAAAWGDYDADGDLDVFFSGGDGTRPVSKLYNNDSGVFTEVSTNITGTRLSAAVWGDCDNDGDLDLAVSGYTGTVNYSEIYINDGGTFAASGAGLPQVQAGSLDWGDYDNDGDLDLLMTGGTGSGKITSVFNNDGSGSFTDISAGMTGVAYGCAIWGDYDSDGDPDILVTGNTDTVGISKIYRNDGGGVFTDINAGLTGLIYSNAAWGDYDSDGDIDILIMGRSGGNFTEIYMNDGNGSFLRIDAALTGLRFGSCKWCDYDNDGDLDILLTGTDGSNDITKIYRNDSPDRINQKPSAPTNLTSQFSGNDIIFSWQASTDEETPQDGLTYNLYISTESGSGTVKNAMSLIPGGYRKVSRYGNAGQRLSWTFKDAPDGVYYWSVQAVDNNFNGSEFIAEKTKFKGPPAPP
ncbi:MAG: VCBS repeat-containing protein, partial [Candidatus Delongbacteria bacterium]|nr:VCBS repeat-containing protein [Candidatus Delongbacteria bacterium]